MKDYFADMNVRRNARLSNPPAMNDFTLQPMWIRIQTQLDQKPIIHQETISSVQQLGGIGTFVYLFAKVCLCFPYCDSEANTIVNEEKKTVIKNKITYKTLDV